MASNLAQGDFENKSPLSWNLPMRATSSGPTSPQPQEHTISLGSHLRPPSSPKPPSLLKQASTRITVALDNSNVFPPEPKHEEYRPHCTFRACIISSWLVITVLTICFIVLTLHLNEQNQAISDLNEALSTSASTVVDTCNQFTSCWECVNPEHRFNGTFYSGCYWNYQKVGGKAPTNTGTNPYPCKSRMVMGNIIYYTSQVPKSETITLDPSSATNPAAITQVSLQCTTQLETATSPPTNCEEAALTRICPSDKSGSPSNSGFFNSKNCPTTGAIYCCPDSFLGQNGGPGTCVFDPSECQANGSSGCEAKGSPLGR